ncbi:ZRANB3 [Bugula neritina]|uniref:ZRANB3 n=1 Tax=Bugula neritina TaxID=10212 RepID=A0A7J7KR46_BUGNE|nr:ZRANB3 [Bugula neritina]
MLPASLKYQWVEELEKWLPELLPSDINMINSSSDVGNISKCKINIVAYSLLRYGNPNTSVLLKAIRAQQFKVSICDESHNIRNKNTRTANVVVDLIKNSVRCILLSGTPALNKPSELFTQIDSILPGRFGTFTEYTLKYCNARYVYYGRSKVWNVDGATNLDELELKLKQFIMIRRLKKEVLRQLPPKRRQKVPFDLKFDSNSSELQKEITAMQEELERLLNSSGSTVAEVIQPTQGGPVLPVVYEIRSLISQLYTKTCQAKVGPVVEFVLFYTSGEDSNKVLVFAHHHAMMNSIQESLWNANIKHIRIDGTVPTNERNLLVKQFQSDPQTKVAILSILAAGSGLTLTAASAVVFAELYWTPAILMQCEDRAHRIGQTAQSVNIYYLVARGTIDERVWSMVEKKTRVLAMALDGQKKGLSAVNSNKHVSGILSAADVKTPVDADNAVEVDINVEDFFTLADLKGQTANIIGFPVPKQQPAYYS